MREVVKLHHCSKYIYDKNKMNIMPYTISTSISFHSCSCKVQCISTLPSYMFIFPHSLSLLQPHLTSSVQAFEATGRVVHTGDHFISMVQCPAISFWAWQLLMSSVTCAPNASLVGSSSTVLQKSILCWWNCFHCSIFLTKQFSPCLIHIFQTACLVIDDNTKAI